MNSSKGFGYNMPAKIKNFNSLRVAAIWAGLLGLTQALIWIGLTIVGILSYTCQIPLNAKLTYGSLVQTVFMDLYFRGSCTPKGWQDYNNNILKTVSTIFDPTQILIWDCVYLFLAFCWFIASIAILCCVRKNEVKMTVSALYTWITFTAAICLMDIALGIIFGIDYSRFHDAGYNYNLNTINAGTINPYAAMLVAGAISAISLMIIALKGFVLWIINASLVIYLTVRAGMIVNDKDTNDTLFMPRKDSDDILATCPPINAFEEQKSVTAVYVNDGFSTTETIEVNQDAIARAARMSTDVSLQERRFRNLDAFQQYPPVRQGQPSSTPNPNHHHHHHHHKSYHRPESMVTQDTTIVSANAPGSPFPAPDYSPPMARANQSQNGVLRNPGYQK